MLTWATGYLEEKRIRNPRFSIEWLLAHVLEVKRLDLYLMYDRPLTTSNLDDLKPLLKRRALHEPLQYITGQVDFMNVTLSIKPGVLIPRMETEQLVEMILDLYPKNVPISIIDLGTGSGCISIALKKNRPNWKVLATDISEQALEIAVSNAINNDVEICFKNDDLLKSTLDVQESCFQIIVSNPPYILKTEWSRLDSEVVNYEPAIALFCDSTRHMYDSILTFSETCLSKNGHLFLELHENHAQEVLSLFYSHKWKTTLFQDYDKKPRFLKAKKLF